MKASSSIPGCSQTLHLFSLLDVYAIGSVVTQIGTSSRAGSPARSLLCKIYIKSSSSSGPLSHNCNLFLSKFKRGLVIILKHHWYHLRKVVGMFASCLLNIDSDFMQKYKSFCLLCNPSTFIPLKQKFFHQTRCDFRHLITIIKLLLENQLCNF